MSSFCKKLEQKGDFYFSKLALASDFALYIKVYKNKLLSFVFGPLVSIIVQNIKKFAQIFTELQSNTK